MSFEGYEQLLCKAGHHWCEDVHNYEEKICPHCGGEIAWSNLVDETNCDSDGYIEMGQFLSEPPKNEICNLGHTHQIAPAVYSIPTQQQTNQARTYCDYSTEPTTLRKIN